MRHLQERLVVMTRLPFDGAMASAVVTAREVPVLVIEPERLPRARALHGLKFPATGPFPARAPAVLSPREFPSW